MTEAKTVLVIDDNEHIAEATCRLLKVLGCKATACCDPAESLVFAQQMQPELVLLDISMPGITGLELIDRLRRRVHAPCKVIAVTGHSDPEMRQSCARAGFDGFIAKPAGVLALESALETQ
jgi:two-component system response regulator EvgA